MSFERFAGEDLALARQAVEPAPGTPRALGLDVFPLAREPAGPLQTGEDRIESARLQLGFLSDLQPVARLGGAVEQCVEKEQRLRRDAGFVSHCCKST